MMNTKPELMDQAVLYMKIYALGMPAMAVYNFGNGVLSARGDTKRPLIYLSIAGVINVLLNLFLLSSVIWPPQVWQLPARSPCIYPLLW